MSSTDRLSWSLNNPDFTGWNFTENVMYRAQLVWDSTNLVWVKMTQPGGGGGGGGGTQYAQGTVNSSPTGTVAMGLNAASGALTSLATDANGNLLVNVAVGGGGGGGGSNAAAGQTGLAVPLYADYSGWNSGGNLVGTSLSNALPIQPGTGATFPVSGSVSVSNFPATQAVSGTVTANQGTNPWVVSGTVNVGTRGWTLSNTTDSVAAVQSGTWNIGSITTLPAITGSVSVSNFPATQPVSGSVSVSNFPASQAVTGTFWQATQPVSIASSVAVTGTFYQATQPVSIAATVNTSDNHTTAAAPLAVRLSDGTNFYTASGGGGSGSNAAAGLTGSPVPTSADYQGWNSGGTLVGTSLTNPLPVAQSATNFFFSSNNSTTAQLASQAMFVGVIESTLSQTQMSFLITSDQPLLLTVFQFIDAAGVYIAEARPFTIMAGIGFSQAIKTNGNYVRITVQNIGNSTTTTLNVNLYYGTIQESTQAIATLNQVTGLPDVLTNGDNLNDYDKPSGNAAGTASTGLLGAEAYPKLFDGVNWNRQRGQIDQGARVYDQTQQELLTQILTELRVSTLLMQQAFGISDNMDAVRNDPSIIVQ